jgi:CheY-like chemotaxis protein
MSAHILIVDDNPTNLKLATDVLLSEGFGVEAAQDADEARAILERRLPDLILMDIALPGMDGLTLTRLLRAQPRFRDTPIVALTASAMRGDEEKALAAGCSGYITKPINTRTFAQQVRALLRSSEGK